MQEKKTLLSEQKVCRDKRQPEELRRTFIQKILTWRFCRVSGLSLGQRKKKTLSFVSNKQTTKKLATESTLVKFRNLLTTYHEEEAQRCR